MVSAAAGLPETFDSWWTSQASRNQQEANKRILFHELKACRSLQRGKEIHVEAVRAGSASCVYLATALVRMYVRCRSMADARQVFESIKNPDVILWTAVISGYADNGEALVALDLFARMRSEGCAPNSFAFVVAIKACTSLALDQNPSGTAECLKRGKAIHSQVGYHSDIYVENTLITMYSKCGSMTSARQVFEDMKQPDMVSWNALILGYAENGEATTSLDMFGRMKSQGYTPNSLTFVSVLKACTCLAENGSERAECLERGKEVHTQISCHSNKYVQSSLINMYAKCGSMVDARHVFESVEQPSVVLWNALILGYADNGEGMAALDMFELMISQCHTPNSLTFVAALKACTTLALDDPNGSGRAECLQHGKKIHLKIGSHANGYVQCSLINMYAKCGSMNEAFDVFKCIDQTTVVSWNALILGYADNGEGGTALDLFARMRSEGCAPNYLTFVAALKACGLLGALEYGCRIHAEMKTGTEPDVILVTCLVDFYAKCGDTAAAHKVFDSYPNTRNLTTWNALLMGYSRLGDSTAVFDLFQRMQDEGFRPNGVTFVGILMCCSHAGLVEKGEECLEAMSLKYGVTPTVEHYTCLVDILGRSNRLNEAVALLERMPCRPNDVTWMTILGACRKWKNVEIGNVAFKALVGLEDTNAAACMLMAHIYGSKGMLKEREMVLAMKKDRKTRNPPGQTCWISDMGEAHTFGQSSALQHTERVYLLR